MMRKSAVNHYAKATDDKGVYPMSFSFFIAGETCPARPSACNCLSVVVKKRGVEIVR